VEDEAFAQLKAVLEREAYLYVQRQARHTLPYAEFQRAKELGIELPEADPVYGWVCCTGWRSRAG